MSLHYEWVLSLRLRPDVPDDFLAELRFHLGLAEAPAEPELEYGPCLVGGYDGEPLPGGEVRSLTPSLGLFARNYVLDDGLYELMQTVPPWLARWSATQGWIGYAREEAGLNPWLNFYVQDGFAYAGEPAGPIKALTDDAPPFTLTATCD